MKVFRNNKKKSSEKINSNSQGCCIFKLKKIKSFLKQFRTSKEIRENTRENSVCPLNSIYT